MDKILRIDVGAQGGPKATVEPIGRYATLGGRAMTSTVIWEEVPADCDPRGPLNKLVFAPGIMGGTLATTSGRLSVGCKSPLTGTIKESNAGGQAGHAIAKLGYAAIIIEGEKRSAGLLKVVIDKDGITFSACDDLEMLGNYAVADKIKAEHGEKVALIAIGQAGEQLLGNSSIAVTDMEFRPTRHAARGGPGAVMGSKGVKAIVIDAVGVPFRTPLDPEGFKQANRKLVKALTQSDYTGQALPLFGTAMLSEMVNEMGAYPALGATQGHWEGVKKINAASLTTLENERGGEGAATHGCHTGCIIRCSGTFRDKYGKFVSKQPEYETIWAHGGYCGIDDLDAIARLDRLDDDLGLDTIEMGCTIGVMMQAGELEMGDAEGAIALVEEVGKGTEKGKLLGSGTMAVAKQYGVERVPVVKGQAMAAYDPRSMKGVGVTYATSPMGADHTAGNPIAHHIGMAEPFVDARGAEKQWFVSALSQISSAAFDATGFCLFLGFATLDKPEAVKHLLDSMSAFTGINYNETSFAAMGIGVLKKELDFNRRAGFTEEDDKLPDYILNEPLSPYDTVFDVPADEVKKVKDHAGFIFEMMGDVASAFSPPIAQFGPGAHKMVPDNLATLGVNKALIVTDKGVVAVGLLEMLTDAFDAKHMDYVVFDGTEPNPTVHNVNDALKMYREEGCNGLVSLGGGSSHDCCKGVGIMVTNPGSIVDYAGVFMVKNLLPPMICVNTTSGTGAEGTFAAVISDKEQHLKMPFADPKLAPIIAVNDPLLTRTMPPHITASTGIDALTHCVEALINKYSNPFADSLALHGIKLIAENLERAVENGDDMDARLNMCYAQYNGGIAFSSSPTGNVHSAAQALGGVFNLPHGECNGIMLVPVLQKNKAAAAGKIASAAVPLGIDRSGMSDDEAAGAVISYIEKLLVRIGIPATITELAKRYKAEANQKDMEALIEHAMQDPCNVANPVTFTKDDYKEIFEAKW